MPPNPSPTRFSDGQALLIADLALSHFEEVPIHRLLAEIVGLNRREIGEPVAQLLGELLEAGGHRAGAKTWAALRALMTAAGPDEDPADRISRLLNAAATGIALGLHREAQGEMLRCLIEALVRRRAASWRWLLREIDLRVLAEGA